MRYLRDAHFVSGAPLRLTNVRQMHQQFARSASEKATKLPAGLLIKALDPLNTY